MQGRLFWRLMLLGFKVCESLVDPIGDFLVLGHRRLGAFTALLIRRWACRSFGFGRGLHEGRKPRMPQEHGVRWTIIRVLVQACADKRMRFVGVSCFGKGWGIPVDNRL